MSDSIQQILADVVDDESVVLTEKIQSLWSGYGQIVRIFSPKVDRHFIVKIVAPENTGDHPRGWNTLTGHKRKVASYQVENQFYQQYAQMTDEHCKVPILVRAQTETNKTLLVMEDLDHAGFGVRKEEGQWHDLQIAIRWLAYFHARFMGTSAKGLWPIGSYWHLDTRKEEWQAMPEGQLKQAAGNINDTLNSAKFQTLVHGDAKYANLCFSDQLDRVAAVDFQYVGRGVGVKDLAYLAGSCLNSEQLFHFDEKILTTYLNELKAALNHYQCTLNIADVIAEYKQLYPLAWADFHRFLLGWNPQSWKICDYMNLQTDIALSQR